MDLEQIVGRGALVAGEARLPWGDPAFSRRMLVEHLDVDHDLASRRPATIDRHVTWLSSLSPVGPSRVLDLGCGPGLHLERLAAIGWTGVGVDVAPAAIGHARARVEQTGAACTYHLGDLRDTDVEGTFDLVLCLFGELSTFPLDDLEVVLRRIAGCLSRDGRAVIELSTHDGVRRKGERPSSWYSTVGGLFDDGPHLVLRESAWLEADAASVERWWVLTPNAAAPTMLGSTTWWHGAHLEQALDAAGLVVAGRYGDLTGATIADGDDFETIVVRRR